MSHKLQLVIYWICGGGAEYKEGTGVGLAISATVTGYWFGGGNSVCSVVCSITQCAVYSLPLLCAVTSFVCSVF